jgi:hypothetical protein
MNTFLQLLILLRLTRRETPPRPQLPAVDLRPELYEHREPQGPPPFAEPDPCSRFVSDEDMIIRQLEIRFNGPSPATPPTQQ